LHGANTDRSCSKTWVTTCGKANTLKNKGRFSHFLPGFVFSQLGNSKKMPTYGPAVQQVEDTRFSSGQLESRRPTFKVQLVLGVLFDVVSKTSHKSRL